MKSCYILSFLFVVANLVVVRSDTEKKVYESSSEQTALIELYTSEGCSSCPPADEYVSTFSKNRGLWKTFVPVVFHVDYWDYLGWRDVFAKTVYSQRQRKYARYWRARTIYTPGFAKNGEEWRRKRNENFTKGGKVGVLKASTYDDKNYEMEFRPTERKAKKYIANIAILGNGIVSKVKSGENAGRTLHHDFTVLQHVTKAMVFENDKWRAKVTHLTTSGTKAKSYSIAFWIEDGKKPIQATGGFIKK